MLLTLQFLQFLCFFGFFGLSAFLAAAVAAPAPSAKDRDVIHVVFVVFLFVVHFDENADRLPEHVDALHLAAEAIAPLNFVADFGQIAVELLISIRLVFEAAHETPADAGDLSGIEGEVLLFCHLDGNRNEVAHPGVAAQRSAADAVAAQYFGLVADADLAQFDARAENAGQVLDQVAEVHASVRCKVEKHFAVVKSILRIDELHVQPVGVDLLLADAVGFLLLDAVVLLGLGVGGGCDADHFFERQVELADLDVHGHADDRSVLDAASRLDDDV